MNTRKSWLSLLLAGVVALNLYFHFTFTGTLNDRAAWLDGLFGKLLNPLQYLFHSAEEASASGTLYLHQLLTANKENAKLRTELEASKLALASMKELQLENERLRVLLEFKKTEPPSFLAAKVIARDLSLFSRSFEINRGSEDGVFESAAVICPAGAVGRVLKTNKRTSTVLLITDLNSRIDAIVQRSRSRVIVGGSTEGELALRFLPRRYDIHEGDELVTTGLGGFFPPGFRIGSIVGLAQDPNLVLQEAEVEPAVDFDSLEEVFVVRQTEGG